MERLKNSNIGRLLQRLIPQNRLTRRWLKNAFFLTVVFLLVLQVLFTVMLRYYYYEGTQTALESRAQLYHKTVEFYWGPDTVLTGDISRDMIAHFSDKDKMELQVLDAAGQIQVSSTGFMPEDLTTPDFKAALSQPEGVGVWHGRSDSGETVMALTMLETDSAGTVLGALRYVVSLSAVDKQIVFLSLLVLGLILLIILFVSLSGVYFINSIVAPVSAINKTARRIAMGEYEARLEKQYNDEIGELCDTINFMAGEISAAERMKNEFISSVSHELRTPLTAIKGWTETLQEAGADKDLTAQGLTVIGKEAKRLSGLVEELLDFSRMEGGHIALRPTRLDVGAELEEAVFLLRDKASRGGVTLEFVERPGLPPVQGDAARIKQVFVNLLDNAVKFSRPGDRVRAEAAVVGDRIQIVISDTGVGIPPEKLPFVTRKFYQGESGEAGAGIGLAVAEEILHLHGGSMEIDSELQVGTTVTVWLPLDKSL